VPVTCAATASGSIAMRAGAGSLASRRQAVAACRRWIALFGVIAAGWLAPALPLLAQSPAAGDAAVGEVTFAQGAVSAQRPGEPPRFLIQGDPIGQGDVISTSARGFAQIGLKDGTKMTLRPNTQFAVTRFSQRPGEESIAMQLLRGGLRAITGLVSKAGPDRMRLQTTTATIGVRGTEFDARLCEGECRNEQRAAQPAPAAAAQEAVVARVAALSGAVVAVGASGAPRALAADAALFNGERVRTAAGSWAVLAFRDRSVITVVSASEVRIEDVRVRPQQPEQESFVVRLLTGGLRALTGQIAARNPRSVRFQTTTATIGVRGTGLDLRIAQHCIGETCTGESTFAYPWSRSIVFLSDKDLILPFKDGTPGDAAGVRSGKDLTWYDITLEVETGRAGVFNPAQKQVLLLDQVPAFFLEEVAPRPDELKVDFDRLFALSRFNDAPPGLYVGVRDGNVSLIGPDGLIDLGPLESGFLAEGSARPVRFANLPAFLFNDPFPTPDIPGSKVRILPLIGLGSEAGSTACEVR
jgi:hypothetical protein